jgi:transporter family protein
MKDWIVYALLSLVCFGLWGIFAKLATFYIKAQHAIVYETLGFIIASLFILINYKFKIDINVEGIIYSTLIGITAVVGTLFLLLAINKGNTAVVTFITSLYPNLVLLVSFFIFKEPISMQQGIAILLAFISVMLFTLG